MKTVYFSQSPKKEKVKQNSEIKTAKSTETCKFFHVTGTANEFTKFSKFYKRNDAKTRVHLKMIAITLGSIVFN